MKKIGLILLIVFIGIFILSCVYDHVYYCPYCGSGNVSDIPIDNGTHTAYLCGNNACKKIFGAMEITSP